MARTGVIISTNMKSTHGAERIYDAVCDTDVENGMVGYLDELAVGEDVIYTFKKGTMAGKTLVIVDQPVWDYDTTKRTNQCKDKFSVEVGTVFRVRTLAKGDEFGINNAAVTTASLGNLDVDAFLTVDNATGKFVASSSTTASAQFEAVVLRKKMQGATLITGVRTYGYANEIFEVGVKTIA